MNIKYEKYKRVYRMMATLIMVAVEAAIFWYVWMEYYNVDEVMGAGFTFAKRGNYVMLGLYVILLFTFMNLYGASKIGYQKLTNMVYSQSLSVVCVNMITYLETSLISNKLVTPLPLLWMTLVDVASIIIVSFLLNYGYERMFPPRKLVIVYGDYQDGAESLIQKMNSRKEKYIIDDRIHYGAGYDRIVERIDAHPQGAVLCDVPAELRNRLIKHCYGASIRVYVCPNISDIILRSSEDLHFFDSPLLLARNGGLSIEQKIIKRGMDILISGLGLLIASPFMLITALAIKLYDGGPVFYRQARATNGGKVFYITKFRSMIVDAEKDGRVIPATEKDPRITPVGHVIRATRMDELPQLFDILRGDMSVVGPRPERLEHVEKYTADIPEFAYRLKVKGGLTGFAQIYGKYNTSAYDKLKLDLMYIENYSILLDIKLILMTVKILFMKESTEGFTDEKSADMEKAAEMERLIHRKDAEAGDRAGRKEQDKKD